MDNSNDSLDLACTGVYYLDNYKSGRSWKFEINGVASSWSYRSRAEAIEALDVAMGFEAITHE